MTNLNSYEEFNTVFNLINNLLSANIIFLNANQLEEYQQLQHSLDLTQSRDIVKKIDDVIQNIEVNENLATYFESVADESDEPDFENYLNASEEKTKHDFALTNYLNSAEINLLQSNAQLTKILLKLQDNYQLDATSLKIIKDNNFDMEEQSQLLDPEQLQGHTDEKMQSRQALREEILAATQNLLQDEEKISEYNELSSYLNENIENDELFSEESFTSSSDLADTSLHDKKEELKGLSNDNLASLETQNTLLREKSSTIKFSSSLESLETQNIDSEDGDYNSFRKELEQLENLVTELNTIKNSNSKELLIEIKDLQKLNSPLLFSENKYAATELIKLIKNQVVHIQEENFQSYLQDTKENKKPKKLASNNLKNNSNHLNDLNKTVVVKNVNNKAKALPHEAQTQENKKPVNINKLFNELLSLPQTLWMPLAENEKNTSLVNQNIASLPSIEEQQKAKEQIKVSSKSISLNFHLNQEALTNSSDIDQKGVEIILKVNGPISLLLALKQSNILYGIDENKFLELAEICNKINIQKLPDNSNDLQDYYLKFNEILAQTKVLTHTSIKLFGDTLSENMLENKLTLELLKKLSTQNTDIQIMPSVSNVKAIESYHNFINTNSNKTKTKLKAAADSASLFTDYFQPNFQLLGFNEDPLTIYSPVKIDDKLLKDLAEELNLPRDKDIPLINQRAYPIFNNNDRITLIKSINRFCQDTANIAITLDILGNRPRDRRNNYNLQQELDLNLKEGELIFEYQNNIQKIKSFENEILELENSHASLQKNYIEDINKSLNPKLQVAQTHPNQNTRKYKTRQIEEKITKELKDLKINNSLVNIIHKQRALRDLISNLDFRNQQLEKLLESPVPLTEKYREELIFKLHENKDRIPERDPLLELITEFKLPFNRESIEKLYKLVNQTLRFKSNADQELKVKSTKLDTIQEDIYDDPDISSNLALDSEILNVESFLTNQEDENLYENLDFNSDVLNTEDNFNQSLNTNSAENADTIRESKSKKINNDFVNFNKLIGSIAEKFGFERSKDTKENIKNIRKKIDELNTENPNVGTSAYHNNKVNTVIDALYKYYNQNPLFPFLKNKIFTSTCDINQYKYVIPNISDDTALVNIKFTESLVPAAEIHQALTKELNNLESLIQNFKGGTRKGNSKLLKIIEEFKKGLPLNPGIEDQIAINTAIRYIKIQLLSAPTVAKFNHDPAHNKTILNNLNNYFQKSTEAAGFIKNYADRNNTIHHLKRDFSEIKILADNYKKILQDKERNQRIKKSPQEAEDIFNKNLNNLNQQYQKLEEKLWQRTKNIAVLILEERNAIHLYEKSGALGITDTLYYKNKHKYLSKNHPNTQKEASYAEANPMNSKELSKNMPTKPYPVNSVGIFAKAAPKVIEINITKSAEGELQITKNSSLSHNLKNQIAILKQQNSKTKEATVLAKKDIDKSSSKHKESKPLENGDNNLKM